MKLFNIKSLVGVAALGLALIAGASNASAQGLGHLSRSEREYIKQQRKLEKQRVKYERARYRVYRNGGWYNTDQRGADLLRRAINDGYRQGFSAGRSDRNRRGGLNWGGNSIYRSGTYGWQSYVDRNTYQHYFRQGFERGYRDGYNSGNRLQYGTYNNGAANILGSILGSILNIQRY
jgi:hypothetical protein